MNEGISLAIAFGEGVLSFLSPCVLALVPAYVTYLGNLMLEEENLYPGQRHRGALFFAAVAFVAGFSLVFIIMGASVTALSQLFSAHQPLFRRIGGVLIIFLGFYSAGLLNIPRLSRHYGPGFFLEARGIAGAGLLGMAFAIGWTPCVGPVLASILIFAGTQETYIMGINLLLVYALGMGVPFLVTALALESIKSLLAKIAPWFPVLQAVNAGILVILGVLVFFNLLPLLTAYLSY